ncbi:MAG: transcription-repair coupling factor [Candidatus Omnitrophica bacterium]|nr:transcription-repair coupling factor [Candidatus Omnitrophota bacterium]
MKLHRLSTGLTYEREELENLLRGLNYQKKEMVSRPGEYSIRGSLVDVYPFTYRSPVRLEFRLDHLTAIRDFSPLDGKSFSCYDDVYLLPLTGEIQDKISRARERFESYEPLTDYHDLERGDYVVHFEYGIGRFLGTKIIQTLGVKKRHLAIEYADREILYVDLQDPVERYIGGEGAAPRLTRLNTKDWERAKEKTRLAVQSVARGLLELQAKRSLRHGTKFPRDAAWQKEFEAEFPFELTPDQAKAVTEAKEDMESEHPMDRLVCGDVGYGKTEVAMRACFKAVTGGKQVAVLVPTTVLAEQHYLVLKKRLKSFPVTVDVLSRFRSKREQSASVKALREGVTDIVIGTHRLLSQDIHFKDLGLVIVDEEQRFGVLHKERLKELRYSVDVLSLTATPIPRTLYMSLMGVRDMSIINTPPKNRLAVETHVLEYNEKRVMDAVQRELDRGGQVYFVHNRVQSILKVRDQLQELLPHVCFGVAHGQMPSEALEAIMQDFMEKRIDCLISTSIIESGIDIPNANTLIVNRADQFGLADLYQLRGRVGRFKEKRQAYAYFFVPQNWVLSGDAEKRLTAIERFTELGSGFKIALEDLSIRGAGNLLGHEQSGFIHAVGFDLYCRMLRKAVEDQKSESPVSGGKAFLEKTREL